METLRRRRARRTGEASCDVLRAADRMAVAAVFALFLLLVHANYESLFLVLTVENGGKETVELVCLSRAFGTGKLYLQMRPVPWALRRLGGRERHVLTLAPGASGEIRLVGQGDSEWVGVLVRGADGRIRHDGRRWHLVDVGLPGLGLLARGRLRLRDPSALPSAPPALARLFPR